MALVCKKPGVVANEIGKGAYGTIYLVEEKSTKYVLKVASDATDERAKHLALWHMLPVSCKKYFITPYTLPSYCKPALPRYGLHAMEYIHGKNMRDYIRDNLTLGNKQAVKIVLAMLKEALMCLWKSGFVHMDLHLGNVLVTNGSIKIIDFGMSEAVTPLGSPKTKKELEAWFSNKYVKGLKKLGLQRTNPNLYAYGIKKHKMYYGPNQKLYNQMHKMSSIKRT